ncbi:MAG: 50S ribosomal protein L11 methyltransferase [Gemmatimonadota bacterium]
MTWWAIEVRVEAVGRSRVAAWLVNETGQAVEERDDGSIISFAEDESAAESLTGRLTSAFGAGVKVHRHPLDNIDWSTRWRDGLGPRRVGRLTVVPSWVNYQRAPDEAVVVMDPETAFGSGEHGSTRAALRLLSDCLVPGQLVLDLGSGSGILSIGAVRLGARRAIGIEVDEEALPVAVRNAAANGVADRAQFMIGDAADLAPLLGPADLVMSNILRTVNVTLFPAIRAALRPGGTAIFSGMEEGEAAEFRASLAVADFTIHSEVLDSGWWGVAATRT